MVNKISRLISEHNQRKNRLHRYWQRLSKEAFRVAGERGIGIFASNGPADGSVEERIYLFSDEEFDDSDLLKLAKPNLHSLYRRYQDGLQKHRESLGHLEEYIGSAQAALL